MGLFSVGFQPAECYSSSSAPTPFFDITSNFSEFSVLEISMRLVGPSSRFELGFSPTPPSQLNPTRLPNDDPRKQPSKATYGTAWGVNPAIPAPLRYLRRIWGPFDIIWTWPRGLTVQRNAVLAGWPGAGADVGLTVNTHINIQISE